MRLGNRLLYLMSFTAASAMLVASAVIYLQLMPDFRALENDAVRQHVSRVEKALVQMLTSLHARTLDWAVQPQIGAALDGKLDANKLKLPHASLGSQRIEDIVLFDPAGKMRWLRGNEVSSSAVDGRLRNLFHEFSAQGGYSFWGVARLAGQPVMFAMEPVPGAHEDDDPRGALFFGITLDNDLARELSSITDLPVRFVPVKPGEADSQRVTVRPLDSGKILGTFVVRSYTNEPVLKGELALSRPVYDRAVTTLTWLLVSMTVIAVIATALVLWRIHALIFRRLRRLHETVKRIATGQDLSFRMNLAGNDELSELASDFNRMVDNIRGAQKSLARAREEAESANRAKSLFLANMSHEIRTPMTAILGYAELVRDPRLTETERRHYLDILQQNGDALLELISDILDLSRIEAGQMKVECQPTALTHLLQDVINSMQLKAAEKGLSLELEYDTPVPASVETDAFRIRQILINLIGNAIKFTSVGGVSVRVLWQADPDRLTIAVRDTGIGIPEVALARIFEPFLQMDASHTRRFGGSGLGLAIVRQLARSLDGDITVQSRPGEGSEFTLSVPARQVGGSDRVQPETATTEPADTLQTDTGNEQVVPSTLRLSGTALLAEDNSVNRMLVSRVLERAGMFVVEVENGRQAVDWFDNSRSVDLVIMDMQMPVMDGYATARALRNLGYRGPMAALTANVMAEDRQRCLDAGCDEFIPKPVRVGELLRICQRLLGQTGQGDWDENGLA